MLKIRIIIYIPEVFFDVLVFLDFIHLGCSVLRSFAKKMFMA